MKNNILVAPSIIAAAYVIVASGSDGHLLLSVQIIFVAVFVSSFMHELAHYGAALFTNASPSWSWVDTSVYSRPRSIWHQRLISLGGPIAGAVFSLMYLSLSLALNLAAINVILVCLLISHVCMLLPIFDDGILIFMKRRNFSAHIINHKTEV